jgi:alanyl-tRNA synthetase
MSQYTSSKIRETFFEFFRQKQHQIVSSAPIVLKNDPTLMFTNAGMNQFKDFFLGNAKPTNPRIADTQKCLRVSGKHNDLEEVGVDTYHHTMFEMLGNWSFGDYFKEEAIDWAWELLTEVYKMSSQNLYVTIFEGDKEENLEKDTEAIEYWKKHLPEDRILAFGKKDNFWEMGDTGPCGPCSEIHVDLRSDEEKKLVPGKDLVNIGHPQVIEIWNLVFIQYNRKANGSLEDLPDKHVDTGMGFERLCRTLQGKSSNYDTDIFVPLLEKITEISGITYGKDEKTDIAFRVISDHVRAVSFCIADGQLPSNTGAGYVIRRILRRAIRYGYSFLQLRDAFIYSLVEILSDQFAAVFPELKAQIEFVEKVIKEEEINFLRTLENGLKRFEQLISDTKENQTIDGKSVFELYDTYGFPTDLTKLLARERGREIDEEGFQMAMNQQKERSKKDASKQVGDWIEVLKNTDSKFVGYDSLEVETEIVKYRTIQRKNKEVCQIVLKENPFYPEGGGQQGDIGKIISGSQDFTVTDTVKENDLIIVEVEESLSESVGKIKAQVDISYRNSSCKNHSATHLLQAALKKVLGKHVEQKGSLLNDEYLRFDFSHFEKVSEEQLLEVEKIVNQKIMQNIPLQEYRNIPKEEALAKGAMALFGEKYGDTVRMIVFDDTYSIELCGGTHVKNTGEIGLFKITSESAIAAGVRRIEAVTGNNAWEYLYEKLDILKQIQVTLNQNTDIAKSVENLKNENQQLRKTIDGLKEAQIPAIKQQILSKAEKNKEITLYFAHLGEIDGGLSKKIATELKQEKENSIIALGNYADGKAFLTIAIDDALSKKYNLHAGNIVKEVAKQINGGGGGQPFLATAGGTLISGIDKALSEVKSLVLSKIEE